VSPSTIVPGVPAEAGASRASGTLRVTLPVVVSWRRPRLVRGRVRYPATYADEREAWAGAVRAAVATSGWRPLPRARYGVTVTVSGGGRRDLDRVCTAVLDALQRGLALPDDCLVDALTAVRRAALPRTASATAATLATLPTVARPKGASGIGSASVPDAGCASPLRPSGTRKHRMTPSGSGSRPGESG
jgi:hypothetical protein